MPCKANLVVLYDTDPKKLATEDDILRHVDLVRVGVSRFMGSQHIHAPSFPWQVKPHIVAMCVDIVSKESMARAREFWLPALSNSPLQPTIALLVLRFDEGGNLSCIAADGEPQTALEDLANPLMHAFPLNCALRRCTVRHCPHTHTPDTPCAAVTTYANAVASPVTVTNAVGDLVHHSQFPHRPLVEEDERLPTPGFKRALKRIFRSLDIRGHSLLGVQELSRLKQYVYGIPEKSSESVGLIAFVQDRFPDGVAALPTATSVTSVDPHTGLTTTTTTTAAAATSTPTGTTGSGITFDGWQSLNISHLHDNWEELVWSMLRAMHCGLAPPRDLQPPAAAVLDAVAAAAPGRLPAPSATLLRYLLLRRGVRAGLAHCPPPAVAAWGTAHADQLVTLSVEGTTFLEHLFDHYTRFALCGETGRLVRDSEAGDGDMPVLTPSCVDRVFATLGVVVDVNAAGSAKAAAAYYGAGTTALLPSVAAPGTPPGHAVSYTPPDGVEAAPGSNAVYGFTAARQLGPGVTCDVPSDQPTQAELLVGEPREDALLKVAMGWWGHPFGPTFPWTVPHAVLASEDAEADVPQAVAVAQQYGSGFAARAGAAACLSAQVAMNTGEALAVATAAAQAADVDLPLPTDPEGAADPDTAAAALAAVPEDPLLADVASAVQVWQHWTHAHRAVAAWAAAEQQAVPLRTWALNKEQWLGAWHLLAAVYPQIALRCLVGLGFLTHSRGGRGGGPTRAGRDSKAAALAAARAAGPDFSIAPDAVAGWLSEPLAVAHGAGDSLLPPALDELRGDAEAVAAAERLTAATQDPHLALTCTPARKAAPFIPCPTRTVYVLGSPGVGKTSLLQKSLARREARRLPWPAARAAVAAAPTEGEPAPALSTVEAAAVACQVQGGVPQPILLPAPLLNLEQERASAKQHGEDWDQRREELRSWPQHLLAVEWPADHLGTAMAKARWEADVVVVLVDPSDAGSVQFMDQALSSVPDQTPCVVVKAVRPGAGATGRDDAAAVTAACDTLGVEAHFTYVDGSTSAKQVKESLWRSVAYYACDHREGSPLTPERLARAADAKWRSELHTAAKTLAVVGVVAAGASAAYVYRKELSQGAAALRRWVVGLFTAEAAEPAPAPAAK